MSDVTIEFRNFRAHQALAAPAAYDPNVPLPSAGDIVEFEEHPYVCRHRSFEYGAGGLVKVYVMVEPDEG
jgi:hypothetical protein